MAKKLVLDDEEFFDAEDGSAESEDDLTGVSPASIGRVVVWGTDWTAATIVDQLRRGTIRLDPAFQRRDAWTDERKSRFIESLFLGLPIPQLVLAESDTGKGKFIVIDGKQRLLSLSRFTGIGLSEGQIPLSLTGLKVRNDLNGSTYASMQREVKHENLLAEFENQSIRTVVIRDWKNEEVLYTIFHRLNTGSVPLSAQELRQALHPGQFLSFAASFSEVSKPLQSLLGISKPDFRMRDVELLVRHFAFKLYLGQYKGNLKQFLDETCDKLNKVWDKDKDRLTEVGVNLNESISSALKIFTTPNAFRMWDGSSFEKRPNRAIFDVLSYTLSDARIRTAALKQRSAVVEGFKRLCTDEEFRHSVTSTTKSKTAVRIRFRKWSKVLGDILKKKITVPLPPE